MYKLTPEVTGVGDIIQTASAILSTDASSTSTTYVDLLTLTITTFGGTSLAIYSSFSRSNSNNGADSGFDYFQLTVDGVSIIQAGEERWNVSETGGMFCKVGPLNSGSHPIALQWKTTGGTLRCYAQTLPRPEHASIVVLETWV